jgi:hypothetical protein
MAETNEPVMHPRLDRLEKARQLLGVVAPNRHDLPFDEKKHHKGTKANDDHNMYQRPAFNDSVEESPSVESAPENDFSSSNDVTPIRRNDRAQSASHQSELAFDSEEEEECPFDEMPPVKSTLLNKFPMQADSGLSKDSDAPAVLSPRLRLASPPPLLASQVNCRLRLACRSPTLVSDDDDDSSVFDSVSEEVTCEGDEIEVHLEGLEDIKISDSDNDDAPQSASVQDSKDDTAEAPSVKYVGFADHLNTIYDDNTNGDDPYDSDDDSVDAEDPALDSIPGLFREMIAQTFSEEFGALTGKVKVSTIRQELNLGSTGLGKWF